MTEASRDTDGTPILAEQAAYLIGVAARAPSLHNTQPWRFKVGEHAIELYADASRQLREDPAGREMVIVAAPPCTGCASGSARWVICRPSNCPPGGARWPGCGWPVRPR